MPTDSISDRMATSSKPVVHSTSPKNRGWFSGGRKLHIIPSKPPTEEEVISSSPTKKMRQVGKSKSERERMKIYASSQDLGLRNTKWHISLPNIPNTQDAGPSDSVSASPKRNIASPLPPPPSNPPPILNQVSDTTSPYSSGGRSLVKSVSAGAINIVSTARTVGKPQGMVKPVTTNKTDDKLTDANGKPRKGPPPKVPPPYSVKARTVTVTPAATHDHPQSSTRSAPGELQKSDENERSLKLTASDRVTSNGIRVESAETSVVDNPPPAQTPPTSHDPPVATADSESQLTSSMEGSVKLLARYFSARSKEGPGVTAKPASPKRTNVLRPVKGRQNLKKASSIPETVKEEMETTVKKSQVHRLPPIRSISDDSDEKYEALQNVGSMVSTGSPTHVSIFSWYNPAPGSKSEMGDVSKQKYQNVFDDESFACFDKTGPDKESSTSPKYPYKEYQNILVDMATLEETPSSVPSPKEGSYKDKKPIPLPRTQSKDRGMAPQRIRGRPLVTSSSEGSLTLSIPHSTENRNSEYVDIVKELEYSSEFIREKLQGAEDPPESPGIVVLGAMDPEWRERYEELLEKEIEMVEGFSDSDEPTEDTSGHDQFVTAKPVGTPLPFVPVKKSLLKKTQSHNPNEPNICRRNTPKEKRELRRGVCSDSDQFGDQEVDDYVPMQPAQSPESVNNTPLPSMTTSKSARGMDLESSAYYLQIVPSQPFMVKPAAESVKATSTPMKMVKPAQESVKTTSTPIKMVKPAEESVKATSTPIKHYYIEIDIPGDKSDEKQAEKGASTNPTLPPKSSPTHTTGRVVEVPPNGKRKLKYRKVDVVPATQPASSSDTERKTPYSRLKVDSNIEPTGTDNHSQEKQQTQGIPFAKEMLDRPLPPTPSENALYYRTVNHPLGPVSATRPIRHQYIEIDEEEFNRRGIAPLPGPSEGWINIHAVGGPVRVHQTKPRSLTTLPPAPPPPVPRRPSCPYVEIDGDELSEMAESIGDAASLRARAPRMLGHHAGRQDNTGRQRSFSSSGEYAYPLIPGLKLELVNVQKNGEKAYFTPRVVPLHGTSHGPHQNATGAKSLMETITERSEHPSDKPPSLPPKTESLLREQQGFTAKQFTKPSPYLVPVTSAKPSMTKPRKLSAPAIFCNSISPLPPPALIRRQVSPKDVTKEDDRREDGDVERKEGVRLLPSHLLQKKKSMNPPRQPPPYHMSAETRGQSPRIPQKQRKVSREDENSPATTPDSKSTEQELCTSPNHDVANLIPELRKPGLQHRIDRNSLAMIMRNKSAIEKQLGKATDSPKSQRKQIFANNVSESERDVSVVKSLGDVLLDVDALLQQRMCTEDDVIAAIEKQLHIRLVRKKEGGSDRSDAADRKQSDGSALEDSVHVTEQDVQEVVTFMNKSHLALNSEGGRESDDGWMTSSVVVKNGPQDSSRDQVLSPTKDRSSTFIVTQSHQTYAAAPAIQSHAQSTAPFNPYDKLATPTDQSARDEEDGACEESEKSMRDNRSSSVGLKPLRRVKGVKDRRRTNPGGGMANVGSGKLYCTTC